MDLFDKLKSGNSPLGKYAGLGDGYFMFPKLEGEISSRMKFRGKEKIVWSLNNYLGLANHPEVRKADSEASANYGLGLPMGSRMMSGNSDQHEKLEQDLADFVGKEAGYLQNFGYQGMVSAIDCLVNRHDVIVYDAESHACIIDGVRLHQGKRFVFAHNDIDNLEKQLKRAMDIVQTTRGGILVISEGVFGMAGDQGKLKEIAALKEKYHFRFMVDDAHGFGTLGKTGAGAGEAQDCMDAIDVYFSTFAKSFSSIGAFFAANRAVIDHLRFNSRSQIFAKSLPMPLVIGNQKRFDLLKSKPELREKLWHNVNMLQNGLRDRGYNIGNTSSCVTPVYLNSGEVTEAAGLIIDMRETYNIFCSAVIYPVVPKGVLLLRLIPTAVHTEEDINLTLDAFDQVSGKLKRGDYRSVEPQKLVQQIHG